jgi:hypothetical protein
LEKYVHLTNYDEKDTPWRVMTKLKRDFEKLQQVKSDHVVAVQHVPAPS